MWALVLLDMKAGTALLASDRFGVNPLYTYADQEGLLVALEIKAILAASGRRFRVNEADLPPKYFPGPLSGGFVSSDLSEEVVIDFARM